MSNDTIYMDTDQVLAMADDYNSMAETLETVNKALETAMNTLQNTAFIGLVGGAVWAQFIGVIQPRVKKLSEFCAEVSKDLKTAVEKHTEGDEAGAARFH